MMCLAVSSPIEAMRPTKNPGTFITTLQTGMYTVWLPRLIYDHLLRKAHGSLLVVCAFWRHWWYMAGYEWYFRTVARALHLIFATDRSTRQIARHQWHAKCMDWMSSPSWEQRYCFTFETAFCWVATVSCPNARSRAGNMPNLCTAGNMIVWKNSQSGFFLMEINCQCSWFA
jgi:hypothetical protein